MNTTKIPHLDKRSIGEDRILNTEAFVLIEIEFNGLALIGKLACRAETMEKINEMERLTP